MGELSLTILDDRPLSAEYALVTGRFALTRTAAEGGDASGIFTLLMHRAAQGWRIIRPDQGCGLCPGPAINKRASHDGVWDRA